MARALLASIVINKEQPTMTIDFTTIAPEALAHTTGGLITQCGTRLDTKQWGCITYGYDRLGRYYDSSEGGYAAQPPAPGQPAGSRRARTPSR